MVKYIYRGSNDRVYLDVTGRRYYLRPGDVFEPKVKPNWDSIEEHEEHKKKLRRKLR